MTTQTTVLIDGEELDLNIFLTSLNPITTEKRTENPELYTTLKIGDYSDLGYTISSLIGVCQVALGAFADNEELTANEKESYLGAGLPEVIQVLKVAKSLMPNAEFELLNKLQNQKI